MNSRSTAMRVYLALEQLVLRFEADGDEAAADMVRDNMMDPLWLVLSKAEQATLRARRDKGVE